METRVTVKHIMTSVEYPMTEKEKREEEARKREQEREREREEKKGEKCGFCFVSCQRSNGSRARASSERAE